MTNKNKAEDANGTGYEWEYAKKIDNRTTTQKILNFIYDPQTHAFMGRTAKSWGGILLFYAIFYSLLALLFAICMKVLLSTLNTSEPKWQLNDSLLGSNPGLGFRPQTDNPETASVIWYNASNPTNVESWEKLIDTFLEKEYTTNSSRAVNCTYGQKLKPDEFCRFSLDSLGQCSKKFGYGYGTAKPCVFIKLNRIYKWKPEFYTDKLDTPTIMPTELQNKIDKLPKEQRNNVWVTCEGQSPHDKENLGRITYYPEIQGFPEYYYPYLHVKEYMSPLVAVKFEGLRPNVLVNIECKAWARNIVRSEKSQTREGSVHFELQIDRDNVTESANRKNATNTGIPDLTDTPNPNPNQKPHFQEERTSV